ncbi:MAG TPA: MBL fold metallo-hydrolase [Enteractinococcus sp.]
MLLEHIYDPDLAQGSYLIGCQVDNTAVVVDPRRDIQVYLDIAAREGMEIVAVTETHIHADYLSGTLELANATGAQVYVSDEGGPDWTYGAGFNDAVRMKHGYQITIGNITIEAIHTPGHTPEHLAFLVTDGAQTSEPGFMLSGDFVFVGDLGRPDLLDAAAGGIDTRFGGARDLFASLRDHFLTLPDYVQVLPAHGSGSACGKALGAVPTTTIGYERNFSWWGKYLENDDMDGFVEELLSSQPDAHSYFGRMKVQNRQGPAILGELPELIEYSPDDLKPLLDRQEKIFVDTRHHTERYDAAVDGALSIPDASKAATHIAWAYNPEEEERELVIFAQNQEEAASYRDHFIRVGVDVLTGYVPTLDGLLGDGVPVMTLEELASGTSNHLLDMRNITEYAAGFIPGAQQLAASRVLWNQDQLPQDTPIVVYCASGRRAAVGASALRRAGHHVIELDGNFGTWAAIPGNNPTLVDV